MLSYEVLYITSILDFIHTNFFFIHGPSKDKFLTSSLSVKKLIYKYKALGKDKGI